MNIKKIIVNCICGLREGLTIDRNDPDLGHGGDTVPGPQNKKYLILPEHKRKGFIRPLRRSYIHVGIGGHEIDPNDMSKSGLKGNACGVQTRMGLELCETYAANPHFYGSTYCVGCQMHLPVAEFVWDEDGEVVGS